MSLVGRVRQARVRPVSPDEPTAVVFGALGCLVLLSLAFWADLHFQVQLFYAFPIALAAWLFGRWFGIATGVMATVEVILSSTLVGHNPTRALVVLPGLLLVTLVSVGGAEWARRSEELVLELGRRDRRHRQMLEMLNKVGQELIDSKRWDAISQHIATSLSRDLQLDVAWIFRRGAEPSGGDLSLLAYAGRAPVLKEGEDINRGSLGHVARTGVPIQAVSALDLAGRVEGLTESSLEAGVEARLVLPVFVKGAVAGVILLGRSHPYAWPLEEINIAATVAGQLGLAMENASAHRATIEALVRLEEVIQMKSDFLKTVSHELRTPMTVLSGYIDMMEDGSFGAVPDAWSRPLHQMSSKMAELTRIVHLVLEASRAEGPSVQLNLQELDLGVTMAMAVESQEAEADRTHRELRLENPRLPVRVLCDQDKLLVVLRNLIENAIKYSPEGSPIDIGYQSDDDQATIWVADRGSGVPDGSKNLIFEQFHRVDAPELRHIGGTGLGLFIVKQLVELQGGRIGVADRPGGGSVFAFTLPRGNRTQAPPPDQRSAAKEIPREHPEEAVRRQAQAVAFRSR
ncbi:MAG: sensor histidine kinase [Candidatus Dormibacteria bacterium]